jgi:prephenate dehydrogenase
VVSGAGAQVAPVGIVGLGLIGGSLARALQAAGVPVVATDPASAQEARAAGLSVADDIAGLALQRPRIVVLAAPLRAMRAVAGELAEALAGEPGWDPTVTDVGSVKGPVREAVSDAGLGDRYVGAHPMSGTERSGFGASSAELMQGIPWAVTCLPGDAEAGVPGTDPVRLEQVLRLVTGPLGGTAAVLTDELHDEVAALVSHVPHVLANQLLGAVAGAPVRDLALGLAAGSFRDGTRVGLTDPRRTEAMVAENGAWVAPVLRLAARDLERLADALESNAPTHWFFDRPDPVRERLGRPVTRAPPRTPASRSRRCR